MRVALLCDVDQTVYHVGDEAIASAEREQLERRGFTVVPVSRHEKYGPGGTAPADAIDALTFPHDPQDRERYAEEIQQVLGGSDAALPAEDKLFRIREQLRGVDALVIGGGGNLNSRFGWLLLERWAMGLLAHSLGLPVVVAGQTLGPDLTAADRARLRDLFAIARVVAVRDEASAALARCVGPTGSAASAVLCSSDDAAAPILDQRITGPADDAHGAGTEARAGTDDRADTDGRAGAVRGRTLSVTLGSAAPFDEDEYVTALAGIIDRAATALDATVEFVPHMADQDDPDSGDCRLNALVAARLDAPHRLAPIELAAASAARTCAADAVLTTRFHPLVFALASATPVLPIHLDRYGRVRMDGALANAGADQRSLSLEHLLADPAAVDAAIADLAHCADAPDASGPSHGAAALEAITGTWDAIADALQGRDPSAPSPSGDAPAATDTGDRSATAAAAGTRAHSPATAASGESAGTTGEPAQTAIILRTKDRPLLLDRGIQDILGQTVTDWHLVIVNDGGDTDDLTAVVDRYRDELGERITVLHNEQSRGMEAATNQGLAATRSEFVAVHDDDDVWHPRFLARTTRFLADTDDAAVSVRTHIVLERLAGEEPGVYVPYETFPVWPEMHSITLAHFIRINRMVPISLLYRRSVHDTIGLFNVSLPVIGDYEFHLRLLQSMTVGFLDEPLAFWHQRPGSTGASSNSMVAGLRDHHRFDALLRDQYFTTWVEKNGLGLPMFITAALREKADGLHRELADTRRELADMRHQVDAMAHQLEVIEHGVLNGGTINFVKRTGRRVLRRLPGRGR